MIDKEFTDLDFGGDQDFGQILTNPFLDIAARFWDQPRYAAFRVCYRSMRRIDDLVDDRKSRSFPIPAEETEQYRRLIEQSLTELRGGDPSNPFLVELAETMRLFGLPLWPWERLARAMVYDLEHDGFRNIAAFLRYSEGAAIAPASIFVHLCGVGETDDGNYLSPVFDIRKAARPLALFSYLVHIIRDFQKDHREGLNYFADDHLFCRSLNREDLRKIADGGPIPDSFRSLVAQYRTLADYYRAKARRVLDGFLPLLGWRYRLSLEVIYNLYSLVFERIDPVSGIFTAEELNPTPEEVRERLADVIVKHKEDNEL
jgi:phytoene synthase